MGRVGANCSSRCSTVPAWGVAESRAAAVEVADADDDAGDCHR